FKLRTFIGEKISDIQVVKIDNQLYAKRQSSLTKEELEREICRMIEKNGGVIDNLSTLNDELHKKYRQLDLKEFGYSRISSFLRSLKSVTVRENKVTLKK
ncbi:MAG: OST-HTH/LOTUS domain-containing protein, partial [Acetatifactor sp.]|nr:OST-HTH/LOTUS domain-containing protein [Acetatifactor sp.]